MALTKTKIAEAITNGLGYSRDRSKELVETLLEIVKRSLEFGDEVLISNFGKFCVWEKGERKGRNPATGEDKTLRARRVVTFKCSGKLRRKVNDQRKR